MFLCVSKNHVIFGRNKFKKFGAHVFFTVLFSTLYFFRKEAGFCIHLFVRKRFSKTQDVRENSPVYDYL